MKIGVMGLLRAAAMGMVLFGVAAHAQQSAQADGVKEVRLAPGQFHRGAAVPSWVDPFKGLPTTQDKSPLVTLLADTQMTAAPQPAFYVHRAWLANAPSALDELGRYPVDFNPAYQRLQLHTLRVIRGGEVLDRLASAKITFLQRETGLEQGVYSGTVNASILIHDLRVGDVFEIAYTVQGENPVIGSNYVQSVSWDQPSRTEIRRITLLHPINRKISWRMLGDANKEVVKPEESVVGPNRKLRWEGRGLPRTEIEKDIPSDFIPNRYLQFSEFGNWSDVTNWADQLFRPGTAATPELTELIAKLKARPTDDERVSAALSWVQDEIRYFSLALGESSHRPVAPGVTISRRYGDCKDKSLLLIHLLRGLGIPAQPVLVAARSVRGTSKLLPSPYAFDHVIVRAEVDGHSYFLDPTRQGQSGKLGAMGQVWEGAEVLVVQHGNNALTTISSGDLAPVSRNDLEEKIRLAKFGDDGEVEVRHTWSGHYAEMRRVFIAQLPRETLHKVLIEAYERRYPGVNLAAAPEITDDPVNNVITAVMKLTVPKLAISSGASWGLRYGASNFQGAFALPPSVNRNQPFALPFKARTRYTVEIEFPTDVSVITDPVSRSFRDDAFDFFVSRSFRGNRAAVSYDLDMHGGQVEPKRLPAYAANVRRAMESDPGIFVVTRNDVRHRSVPGSATPSLQVQVRTRLEEALEKMSKAIDSGRLTGEDLAQAFCSRAETLVDLGRAEEGMKDAQLAVKTSPNFGRAYACRGNAFFGVGDFARAVGDYGKAITLDPEASEVFYRRGHARFYAGQLRAAADDFARVGIESKGNDDARLYAELWHVWTLKRLGEQPTAVQKKAAAVEPRGEWPRPALAMLHGLLSVEEMLALLDRKKGDDREMALAEAYFYAGQWFYLQGDKAKAADFYRKTREKGMTMYIEHVSAGIELRQMADSK